MLEVNVKFDTIVQNISVDRFENKESKVRQVHAGIHLGNLLSFRVEGHKEHVVTHSHLEAPP